MRDIAVEGSVADKIVGPAQFQVVAENMMAWAHCYPTEKEEFVEGSRDEVGLVGKEHIPQAVTA